MLSDLLVKTFVPGHQNVEDAAVRQRYGTLSGGTGILLNLLLTAGKLTAGLLSGSIAMTGDALNNLTDAASSVVTLVGFRMAGKKADRDHPYGHGRMEYLSGLLVSVIILLVAVELGKSSVDAILHPGALEFSWLAIGVLAASILVKLWMWAFNRNLSGRIHSEALAATAADSISDCAATGAVLAGTLIGHFAGVKLDGFLGLAVAVFIARTGILAAKETLDPILGKAPDPQLVKNIRETVLESDKIVGIHDLSIHDYGPGRVIATLHAEVPVDADVLAAHDAIDHVERVLKARYQVEAVIHMDPIATDDEQVNEMRAKVTALVKDIHPELSIHDFRMTDGPLHTNLIFDVEEPFELTMTTRELMQEIQRRVSELEGNYFAVISVDRPVI